jgi:LCP family protein required for cell wall assembly
MVTKQAGQFPSVGMTLRSYQYDSKDRHNRSAQPKAVKTSRWRRFRRVVTLKRIVLVLLVLILSVGGWLGYKFVYNEHKLFGGNIFSVLHATKLKGEDQGRVNILLAGNSADDPGHDGANLTDSIMIMSIDTRDNKAFLLSIPRDLYTQIGNDGAYGKINEAYPDGQSDNFSQSGFPNGGMGQLEQVINQDMGITIDYYALIDYTALRDAVNAVGGIDVTINSTDPRGLYDPSIDYATHGVLVKLTNGVHHLDGEQALDLARARGDAYGSYGFAGSDFERTQHQRDMLVALKTKIATAGVLSNPAKLSNLLDAIGNNVHTDFSGSEVHRLYDIMQNISSSNIKSLSLNQANGKNLLANYTTSDGEDALIPAAGINNYSAIETFINQQMSSNPVVQEGANIVVLNGTNTSGLAASTKAKLTNQHMIVSQIADAGTTGQTKTAIIDISNGKYPATKAALIKQFGSNVTTQNPYAGVYNANFIIVVGTDQIPGTATSATTQSSGN